MERRVTLRDVAKKAGVHVTTAARAVKNDPRVRAETLALVQKVAKEMSYVPDPMFAAFSAYRIKIRPVEYHSTIAWITNYPTRNGWQHEAFRHYREGAAETLTRYGYRLEDFWLQQPGLTAQRASQILQNRGIRGLLICPLPVTHGHLSLSWDRFASVTFGYTLVRPALHRVTTAHYQNMQISLRYLHHLGYRRIGYVMSDDLGKRVGKLWTAAYRTPPFEEKRRTSIPLHLLTHGPERDPFSERNKKAFCKWVATHRPDAVLAVDRHILDWLVEMGLRVPEDVAYVSPGLQESNVGHAGVVEPSREVGQAAAEFLVGKLTRGDLGLPKLPQRILLDGTWQNGETVRQGSTSARSNAFAPTDA